MTTKSPFKSQKLNRSLTEQIAESIENTILSQQLKPGDRLPPEREFAKIFGVTTVTLREALKSLEEQGLLTRKVGSGTFVSAISHSVIADSMRRYWAHKGCSFEDLCQLRDSLEPDVAALAAERATPEDLEKLEELLRQIEESCRVKDVRQFAEADAAFHESLATASHNALYIAVMSGLQQMMCCWINETAHISIAMVGSISEKTIDIHQRVIDAIRAHDPESARQSMKEHMDSFRNFVVEHADELLVGNEKKRDSDSNLKQEKNDERV